MNLVHTNAFKLARRRRLYARLYGYLFWVLLAAGGAYYVAAQIGEEENSITSGVLQLMESNDFNNLAPTGPKDASN